MTNYEYILVDDPEPKIRRITLNRPKKRNALSNLLRGELFDSLRKADFDPEVNVTIIKGAGTCFSAGYDLSEDQSKNRPWWSPNEQGARNLSWNRNVTQGWFELTDLSKVVIASVHGYCLAGAAELVSSCDLVYVAESAQIGYPPRKIDGTS